MWSDNVGCPTSFFLQHMLKQPRSKLKLTVRLFLLSVFWVTGVLIIIEPGEKYCCMAVNQRRKQEQTYAAAPENISTAVDNQKPADKGSDYNQNIYYTIYFFVPDYGAAFGTPCVRERPASDLVPIAYCFFAAIGTWRSASEFFCK